MDSQLIEKMHIDSYDFGRIIIDGEIFRTDVLLFPNRIRSNWWRKKGHELRIDDLKCVIAEEPDVLVVGTGFYGGLKVPPETEKHLREVKIELITKKTSEACNTFNALVKSNQKIVAALHLTC